MDRIRAALASLRTLFLGLPRLQQIAIVGAVVAVFGVLGGLFLFAQQPEIVDRLQGVDQVEAAQIVQKLKDCRTVYELADNGTTIKVPAARAQEVKLDMAAARPAEGRLDRLRDLQPERPRRARDDRVLPARQPAARPRGRALAHDRAARQRRIGPGPPGPAAGQAADLAAEGADRRGRDQAEAEGARAGRAQARPGQVDPVPALALRRGPQAGQRHDRRQQRRRPDREDAADREAQERPAARTRS